MMWIQIQYYTKLKNKNHAVLSTKITHIAVIRLSAMGDVAMTVPVISAFAKRHPDIKLTIVSRKFLKPLFDAIPNCEFLAVDTKGRHKGFRGILQLYQDLKNIEIDAIADLHNVLRSKVVRYLFSATNIPTAAIDKGRKEKKALVNLKNKDFKQLKTSMQRYLEVFEDLGFLIDESSIVFLEKLPFSKKTENFAGILFEKYSKWIGIAPFAQHDGKVYPSDLMQKVIEQLAQNSSNILYLFGAGPEEIRQLNIYKGSHDTIKVVAGNLKFAQELELISHLDLMLSMDSGNAHLAANYGVAVVTLWGATHPYAGFAPLGQPNEYLITSDRAQFPLLPTSVYGNIEVPGYKDAMRSILPERVVEIIEEIISEK